MTRYGYAAMNTTLREEGVRANRGMRQATFEERGLPYAGELAERNCRDLRRIVEWNLDHDIRFYRITSDLLPWYSQYDLGDLPNAAAVREELEAVGALAADHDVRLTFHPSHFVKLASPDGSVVDNAVVDLENHGALMDAMGLSRTPYNAINVHIGAHYGDKEATGRRFCENLDRLSESVRSRLTVENDDTESLWSVSELVDVVAGRSPTAHRTSSDDVADEAGIPVTYDELHHQFTHRGLSRREAARLAADTWETTPIIHYSESRRLHAGDPTVRPQSHSDYVRGPIRTYGTGADVMIEAKMKERAVLRYRERRTAASGDGDVSR
ncbi:UV DNA damage repair endonuclease UvsE [Haloprofundus salinisoli]|uniref:UV DNA damage repair endonuclease UvsE n=1 Tax=Haloprofundus salinisoli TaxID=2876193 RepID=UPI001CCB7C75|nr:UV DNA damage repair endonuclease UvsE [Haloprofundus salinisoli]